MVLRKIRKKLGEGYLTAKFYSFKPAVKPVNERPVIVIMFDGLMGHGGLLDRIKGIISTQIIAEQLNCSWMIYADSKTFNLFKYLLPVDTSIVAKKNDIVRNVWLSKPLLFYNEFYYKKEQILKLFNKGKTQYHFYCNLDLRESFLPTVSIKDLNERWRQLFFKIFKFNKSFEEHFQTLFNADESICGIHLRFQSLLGDANEDTSRQLKGEERQQLLAGCIAKTLSIINSQAAKQYLIVSDSSIFLNNLQTQIEKLNRPENIQILDGTIGHVDVNHADAVLEKAILDFYLLTKCKTIHQVLGKGMYNSQFSKYAAISGNARYMVDRI